MSPRDSDRANARKYPRTARLDRLVQAVVADSLERNDDDRLALITITGVHVEPNLRHAVVYYATRGNADEEVAEALEEARVPIQRDIAREVRMKRTPLLRFERDPAMDAGWRIEAILKAERDAVVISAELERAAAAIAAAESVALACHVAPDGDALGSMLALHHLCRAARKPSVASWPAPFVVAPHYSYLPGLEFATAPEDFPSAPDVMITFDCGSITRLGELAASAGNARELIVLDHHLSNDRYGTINVIDIDAAATAVVVRALAQRLGWPLTRDAAMCLYTGLVTDTGRFQYQSTTPEVFALAEELSRFELPIPALSRQLFEEHRLAYLKLAGACLARLELDERDGFVMAWVTAADFADSGVTVDETEGLIDLVRRTKEAEVSAVLKETPEGVRVSLRSVTEVDVSAVAAGFGGGGHRYAAGFTSTASLESVKAALREAVAVAVKAISDHR